MNLVAGGLAKSNVTLQNGTNANPGDWITVHADFSALHRAVLNTLIGERGINVTIHYPWTPTTAGTGQWPAIYRINTTDYNFTTSLKLPTSAPYGTYLVVAENLLAVGEAKDQIARKAVWFTIGQDGLTSPTVFYEVELNAWLPDWG
jgi:hypothetical protein